MTDLTDDEPYVTRPQQYEFLRIERGVDLGKGALEGMASRGEGPRYVLINGKALSKRSWLDKWLGELVANAPRKRKRVRTEQASGAAP